MVHFLRRIKKALLKLAHGELTVKDLKASLDNTLQSREGKKIFSVNNCLMYNNSSEDLRCLEVIGKYLIKKDSVLAIYGAGKLCRYMFKHVPELRSVVTLIVEDKPHMQGTRFEGIHVISSSDIPSSVDIVFLCSTKSLQIARMKKKLHKNIEVVTFDILEKVGCHSIPRRAWKPSVKSIYPINIPEIEFHSDMDFILIDLPARNMAFLPNGMGYVHNILKRTGINFQTVDLDIIIYHRFHSQRILDGLEEIITSGGYKMENDPWNMVSSSEDEWEKPELIEYFRPEINEIVDGLKKAWPKIIGISLHNNNIPIAREIVNALRETMPELIVIAGGFSCVHVSLGRRVFPECDYMVMGEAELSLGPLVKALVAGEKPCNLPGILSRYDSPDRVWMPAPVLQDIDSIDFPHYDWADLDLYRNYDGYRLTPIIATRGCRWSQCTFCAECFTWRKRSPRKVVDEFQWLNDRGCDLFMFNESDLNGDPEALLEICDEIIRRKLKITLTGQLRIHKKSDREFFDRLYTAGFRALRFGVDGWSKNTLRLLKKGYTKDIVAQNLRNCHAAGIFVDVNLIIGTPGETDEDVEETIDFICKNKGSIGSMATLRILMLMVGSRYYKDPEHYNIRFLGDKKEIYEKNALLIPDNLWYSENPFIDHEIRLKRLKTIYDALVQEGIRVGDVAKFRTEQVLSELEV
ncbi:MAG: B12-binding domain-containing radical SAM protein [Candidatus Scalindua sp.]|nr:B12-binding domain-containing radical SAM protein [Candidatus Scalindua sp.]